MSLPSKVIIEQLELHAYHGWHKHEKEFGQPFTVDIEFDVDIAIEAASDLLQDALDYDAIVTTVRRLFVESRYKLVEAAAATLARGLLEQFPRVDAVHLRIRKLKPPIPERIGAVGVDLRLTRDQL
ncbi:MULTISPECIES: dihydroneopterin aldolase [unclassified Beijerinckia]|uniref:dihydroneopterin aldolase n=1 Tax=unclassified Beijerinckia TaxID=2638183 RepID=UPI00089B4678|nr:MULTISPECIES: dihydroneopterin aldolase [unclassified Beijerinckia]MDH7797400.1 dihydroneopterin aldolase [Beijerinckia sp. GAS462]SEC84002.1 dihydroneopterin aldolase [Beijerinckia sp. 28-YEA-48]